MNARVKELFHELADLDPEARARYFAEHEIDEETRAQVEELLAFDGGATTMLERGIGDAASRALPQLEGQGWRCGPYSLLELIGRGGMGAVYLAERVDGEVKQQVAVKLLPPGAGDPLRERFLQERQILASLVHPNIARMLDAGRADHGQPFLAMEYVEGRPIDVFAAGFSARQKITLFLKVCSAVSYLHRNLIVHRDLKPSNILVTADGEPKLLDFGIAKILDLATDATLTNMRMMTPDYASPEQVMGGRISTATDIYSLGALLYQLLTGKPAHEFTEHSAQAIAMVVTGREVTRPSKWSPDLKGDLDFILLKALRKDPQERYATVEQFAEDLHAFLESRTVRVRSGNGWYRARKFVRRYWIPVSTAAVVVTSLATGLGAALWEAHIARRETRVATAVENFLEGIFRANSSFQEDPVKARQTTARELLDIGANKIDSELADVPDAKFNILGTLASMYLDLGLDDQAASLERKRVAVARTKYGDNSAELAQGLVNLGGALFASHSAPEEETVLLEAKRILDVRRDFHSQLRGTLCTMLAQHYQSTDLQRALEYSQRAVEVRRQYPRDPELAESLYLEAVVLNFLRRPHEAEPLLGEAVQLSVKLEGDTSPRLSRICAFRGEVQQQLMEFAAAEESLRRAATVAQKVNGNDHVDTLETELRLGAFLAATSRTRAGLQHIEHARDIMLRIRGDADPFYAPQVFLVYGSALADAGRLEDGLDYISRAVANRRRNRPGTRYLGQMLEQQASVLIELGRYAEAQHLTDEAGLIAKDVNAPPTYLGSWDRAWLLVAAGRASEAESALDAFHPSVLETGAPSLDSLKLLITKAEIALVRGDADATAKLAEQVDRAISGLTVRAYLKAVEARAALVEGRAELLRRHPTEALPLLQRSVELRENILDPSSAALAEAQIALADCYRDLGDPEHARELAARARKAMGSHLRAEQRIH